ncbi:hypothetical protein DFH06DRAFT_1155793 [Mycena polygramma]|nr:hypothetical protein DFH06DRAFT_1155793 [Mycena polygramma]
MYPHRPVRIKQPSPNSRNAWVRTSKLLPNHLQPPAMNLFNTCQLATVVLSVFSVIFQTAAAPSAPPVFWIDSGDAPPCGANAQNCRIGIGATNSEGSTSMWILNTNTCQQQTITVPGGDFCSKPFSLGPPGMPPGNFTIEGCGGALSATLNNSPYGSCEYGDLMAASGPCKTATAYYCSGPAVSQ